MERLVNTRRFIQVIFMILPLASLAQDGIIRGSVHGEDGKPVEYASIYVKGAEMGAKTDENGSFQIKRVKRGEYVICASVVGFESQQKLIEVNNNRVATVAFVLRTQAGRLSEVVVTASNSMNEQPASIGKLAIKPMDLPQSVMVIGQQVLKEQQALHLSDVLKNANGVYQMGNTGGFQEEIAGRGFAYGSSNTFKNGSRFNNGVMPEISSLERVEILKGSAAILFGNVAPGGVLNLVTKKPKFERGGEVSMRLGSNSFYKPSFDSYGALNGAGTLAYRINGTYEKANSFRKGVSSERFYVNPSLLFKAGSKTEILVEADFLDDSRTPDYGTGAVNYTVANLPRATFLGASWAQFGAKQSTVSSSVTHSFNSSWKLRAQASVQDYFAKQYGTSRPTGIQADGTWNRALQRSESNENYYLAQLDLTGKFSTGSVQHQVLIGADADKYDTETPAFKITYDPNNPQATVYDVINIYDLSMYSQRTDVPNAERVSVASNVSNRTGVYAQDLVSLTSKIKVLAGLRYTYSSTTSRTRTLASDALKVEEPRYDNAVTPRFGLVYQPMAAMSLFASYANSFNLNSGIDQTGAALAPSFIDQYEVGIKNELFKGALSANVTAYHIVNSNLAQTILATDPLFNPQFPTAQQLAGEVTSKGVEVDIMSKRFHGFSFIAGYSFNDTRYTKSNIYEVGSKLRYNPQHTANASIFYAFSDLQDPRLQGLNLGLSAQYFGDRFAGRSTRLTVQNDAFKLMPLDSFTQLDAMVGYSKKKIGIQCKVSNLFNAMNYFAHDDNSLNPIAPRQFATTVSYRF